MNSTATEPVENIASWLKSKWPFPVFVVGAVFAFVGWLVRPAIENPYVRVSGDVLAVKLSCIPDAAEITFPTSNLVPARVQLVIRSSEGARPFPLRPERVVSDQSATLSVLVPTDVATDAVAAIASGTNPSAHLVVDFRSAPSIDITSVAVRHARVVGNPMCGEVLHSEDLAKAIDRGTVEVLRVFFPQEKVGDLVRLINPGLGVLLICTLVAWTVWLVLWLSFGLGKVSLGTERTRKACMARFGRAPAVMKSKGVQRFVIAEYLRIQRRFVFARVMGPAIGFLLTISSLVAGLHPMEQSTQNTFGFISSLQIALVATFVGLLVRVVAECAIRVYRRVLDKELVALHEEAADAPGG